MIKMKKIILLSICFCLTVLSGCKKPENHPDISLSIATADSKGTLYNIGQDIATLCTKDITYVNMSSIRSQGGIDNLNQVKESSNTLGFAITSIAYESYTGTGNFVDNQNENLRIIAGLYYNPNQIVVKNEDSITSLNDLVGHSFSPGAIKSTTTVEATNHFNAIGINMSTEITTINASFTDSITLMKENKLDGAWVMAGIPNDAVTTMITSANGKLIGLSSATITTMQAQYPWYAKFIIPAGTYEGQEEDIQTTAVKLALVASADLDEEVVYDITKTFWEHLDELKANNPALQSISLSEAATDLADLPLHKGALKYYQEQGIINTMNR